MFEAYRIAVRIAIIDEVAGPLALVARHFARTEDSAAKLQRRLETIKGFFMGGIALAGAGAAFGAPLLFAIDKAAQLQKELIAVQLATHGTADQMDTMRRAIEKVAAVTIFSNIDVAKMAKQIATGTGLSAAQVTGILPVYAKYADVQNLMKGASYSQSVTDAIRAAHGAGYYDPGSLTKYLDLLNKASMFVPGSTSEITRSLAYFQMTAKNVLGLNDENAVLSVALANRLGFSGTRGGTNLTAALTRAIPGVFGSGLLRGRSAEALADMNMVDAAGHARVFKNGKFDVLRWMGLTADYISRQFAQHPAAIARQDIMRDFQRAYGTIGTRLVAALGSPRALGQWRLMAAQFEKLGGVEGMQQSFANQSVWQQWQNAKTNFTSAMTELGITLLPTVTKVLKKFNTAMGELIGWMTRNPGQVERYARDLGLFSVALLGLGALSIATSGVLALATAVGALGTAARYAAGVNSIGMMTQNLGTLSKSIGLLGVSFGSGYEVGSLVWNLMEGTKAADVLGAAIAHLFAFFGSKTAQDALRANGDLRTPTQNLAHASRLAADQNAVLARWWRMLLDASVAYPIAPRASGGTGPQSPPIADISRSSVLVAAANVLRNASKALTPPIAASAAGVRASPSQPMPPLSRYIAAPQASQPITLNTTVNLDGKKIAQATTRHIAGALAAPQTGTSIFDGRQALVPAGGL
ncbi:MAG: hypothetical protein ACREUT_20290 [Steroidobacteraceae bacterium]